MQTLPFDPLTPPDGVSGIRSPHPQTRKNR